MTRPNKRRANFGLAYMAGTRARLITDSFEAVLKAWSDFATRLTDALAKIDVSTIQVTPGGFPRHSIGTHDYKTSQETSNE